VKRIVEKGVGKMRKWFGTDQRDIRAAIGPGIHSCCYEVGQEVRDEFASQFAHAEQFVSRGERIGSGEREISAAVSDGASSLPRELPSKIFLDLAEANRRQLIDAEVSKKNIDASPLCTACYAELLFSHRTEWGVTGRMMALAGVRPE
jgi:copper oxidase (laccase) domain-containing protein